MGFSTEVKEKAYIASARRCCVCKKFKGRNIEVHHIIQKADGGEDSYENAIPLCFDCHAEAGHYNPRHPKGAKYSSSELRSHRDYWYKVVAEGKVSVETIQFTHQYYVTNSIDIVSEIINGDFNNFPIDHIKLVKNKLYDFLKSACLFQNGLDREANIGGDSYSSIDDYLSKHDDAKPVESKWGINQWERTPTLEEVKERLTHLDFVSNYMVTHGASESEIARVVFNEHGCCDSFFEEYILRSAKVVFLALINTTDQDYSCQSLTERVLDNNDFSPVGNSHGDISEFNLNGIPLSPGECLLIPSCIVLTSYSHDSYTPEIPITHEYVDSGETQDTRKIEMRELNSYPTVGPYHQIISVDVSTGLGNYSSEFRPLLMNSQFLISRYWECGCCPHLFIKNKGSNKWCYVGEIFSNNPDRQQVFRISREEPIFRSVEKIKVIELEKETTYINRIVSDGETTIENIVLNFGEELAVDISEARFVDIHGYYSLYDGIYYKNSTQIKYQKIYHKLIDINNNCLTKQIHRTEKSAAADL